jgi:tripartite-type tricarboxylate transporter receptor subunit TctC
MLRTIRSFLGLCLALATAAVAAQSADSTARIVVGFPPGGSADTIARLLADKLKDELKRPVIVENRPGAGGRILAGLLKSMPRDGSVVMFAPDALATTNPFVFKKLGYEVADLTPVSMVAEFPFALATGADTGPKTFAEFQKLVRENPKRADFGSPAAGSPLHFVGLMVGRGIGVDMLHVPFQGGAPLVTALISGQPTVGVNTVTDMLEMHRGGKLRILAVTGIQRAPLLPDVPTFDELGFKQVIRRGFYGVYAPAGTPAAAVATWNGALRRVLQLPEVRDRLSALALVPRASTPEELVQMAREDAAVWEPVIKASGFSVE